MGLAVASAGRPVVVATGEGHDGADLVLVGPGRSPRAGAVVAVSTAAVADINAAVTTFGAALDLLILGRDGGSADPVADVLVAAAAAGTVVAVPRPWVGAARTVGIASGRLVVLGPPPVPAGRGREGPPWVFEAPSADESPGHLAAACALALIGGAVAIVTTQPVVAARAVAVVHGIRSHGRPPAPAGAVTERG